MKIGIFHNLPSGGAKRALYGFVKYLSMQGHRIDVFVPSTADEVFLPLSDYAHSINVFPVRKTFSGTIKSFFLYLPPIKFSLADIEETQRKIAEFIERGDYEVVYIDQDRFTNSPFLLKFIDKPAVYYCAQPSRKSEIELLRRNMFKIVEKRFLARLRKRWQVYAGNRLEKIDRENAASARYILTNSFFTHETVMRLYGVNSFVCYPGVETDFFKPLECVRKNFVLSVGECAFHKGYDFIIRALALIPAENRPRFLIVSNNVDIFWKKILIDLAQEKKVDFEIKQSISNKELLELYNQAKIVVYAPYLEPFGLVPLEAMACKTPVVAVREGGVRESIIHNETGILTERNEAAFAEAIQELLGNEEKQKKLGERGREWVHSAWTLKHAGERLFTHLMKAKSKCH
ncbi:MAG: glycosyltransferase family 4 protein [candidate division WOR-3 bacterium]|nr:glycosyltransferase family 4 protein [candidate division WOR-3 bacterium]